MSEGEVLLINIGSLSAGGRVLRVTNSLAKVQLTKPVCAELSEKIAISRRIHEHYRLIGWGEIRKGKELEPEMNI